MKINCITSVKFYATVKPVQMTTSKQPMLSPPKQIPKATNAESAKANSDIIVTV